MNTYQEKLADILRGVNLGTCSVDQGITAIDALNTETIGEDEDIFNDPCFTKKALINQARLNNMVERDNDRLADLRNRFGIDV